MSSAARKMIERAVLELLVDRLAAAGWSVESLDDGEEVTKVRGRPQLAALVFNLDDCVLHFVKRGKSRNFRQWIKLVRGNDGVDMISDWSIADADAGSDDDFDAQVQGVQERIEGGGVRFPSDDSDLVEKAAAAPAATRPHTRTSYWRCSAPGWPYEPVELRSRAQPDRRVPAGRGPRRRTVARGPRSIARASLRPREVLAREGRALVAQTQAAGGGVLEEQRGQRPPPGAGPEGEPMKTTVTKHKSVAVEVDQRGTFTAKVAGEELTAPSLAALKRKIDAALADAFEPFDAFTIRNFYADGPELEEYRVVGIGAEREKGRSSATWRNDRGLNLKQCYRDTPETRAQAEAYIAKWRANKVERDRMEAEEEALLEAIPLAVFPTKGAA